MFFVKGDLQNGWWVAGKLMRIGLGQCQALGWCDGVAAVMFLRCILQWIIKINLFKECTVI